MSDHFDIRLERKLESSADETEHGIAGVRRIELITGAERRRRWSDNDKARIVVESCAPGANVSEVARRNGLSPQQLFAWRREARTLFQGNDDAAGAATATQQAGVAHSREPDTEAPSFVPVMLAATPPPSGRPGTIEITLGEAIVRVVGQVETATLVAVLRAVRGSS
jgi:transposase